MENRAIDNEQKTGSSKDLRMWMRLKLLTG